MTELSTALKAKIDQWLLRYPPDQKRSGIFAILNVCARRKWRLANR